MIAEPLERGLAEDIENPDLPLEHPNFAVVYQMTATFTNSKFEAKIPPSIYLQVATQLLECSVETAMQGQDLIGSTQTGDLRAVQNGIQKCTRVGIVKPSQLSLRSVRHENSSSGGTPISRQMRPFDDEHCSVTIVIDLDWQHFGMG
ncbi:hypothetical protein ACFX1Z_041573 [Malus domestica]